MAAPQEVPLRDRRVIVVGGSTGIGRGMADSWARLGADVTVCSRTRPAGRGAEALSWEQLDLTDPAAGTALVELAADGVDIACFSSVYYGDRRANFENVAEHEWRRQLDVNVTGLWLTLSATLPSLRKSDKGLFVGVSSEVAFNAGPGRSGYAASKAAAKVLLDSVAQEEGTAGIRIVQVLPSGMVDSAGIRRRRPAGFDYSSYMRPADFASVAEHLATTGGEGHHGDSLVVSEEGTWWPVQESTPVSQSRKIST